MKAEQQPQPAPPSPEVMEQLAYRAQYLQGINQGLAGSIRMLKANLLLARSAGEIFPDAKKQFKQELSDMIQLLEGSE